MRTHGWLVLVTMAMAQGCGGSGEVEPAASPGATAHGATFTIRDTTITAGFDATGVAEPVERALLSTKLMGSVTAVLVQEGDQVRRGQVLARIDARDVDAKRAQVEAGIAAAEAMYADAETQAGRFRALYADSAATRFQLDQVETGLARAEAGLRTARAARSELDAVGSYAAVVAPFAGVVTMRYVDPGAFAAPGAPIVEVQDASRLRVSVSVPTRVARGLRPGQALEAMIEGRALPATIEGLVPSPAGGVYTVNAVVRNPAGEFLPGSAATLRVPDGTRAAILVPAAALVREGDLVGVRVVSGGSADLRWVRTAGDAPATGGLVEVLSGLTAGDVILAGSD
ncbi:MAG: efflux RND transporter periplasmic adaptor subunit [Gemmatimonadales bacterium]|jgi:RND family efflux transporter MFP subunit|nr:efflux RND transporter periplasmic adaptor subunit [Gemmatimonadota bacterium]MBK7785223.1 efflux RND transporter periplasmic adaptor subunit [Gemmatimonadota bacterium]MBP6668349.1 efflux RND transporter periplasmic adaptor subunit [Gemmatimonadales bacterium]